MTTMDYKQILKRIEDVRKELGETAINLNFPQITVIGDQSSGKSSLLTEISGIPFPTNSGITTKCPIVVYTKHNGQLDIPTYTIRRSGCDDLHVKKETLCAEILTLQDSIVGDKKVVESPITIEAEGSAFDDLVLVDLPGIISNGKGKEDVINMIKKYIKPEQSLILIVTEAKQDEETAQALELAKQFDPDEERSIRVLTKYDVFDSEESKLRAKMLVDTVDDLSPHAIICRPNGKEYSYDDETGLLSKYGLPEERSGVKSLRDRLPKLLCKLISTNMPLLKKQVKQVLKENQQQLIEIGIEAPDNTRILLQIQEILQDKASEVPKQLTKSMIQFREKLHKSQDIIDKELVDKLYLHDAFQCIFFQGETTFNKILTIMVDRWQKSIAELIADVELFLDELFDFGILKHVKHSLQNCISNNWEEYRHNLMDKLKQCFQEELKKERKFKTMNHYLTSKYKENLVLPEELLDKIIASIQSETVSIPREDFKVLTLSEVRENMRSLIENALENHSDEFNREPIEEQHKRRILAASKANWAVSHKNLTDNVLSRVQEIVLDGISYWTEKMLIEDDEIKSNTGEDNRIRNKRIKYKENISVMQKCLTILR
jgi:GTPase SAR1 family protein